MTKKIIIGDLEIIKKKGIDYLINNKYLPLKKNDYQNNALKIINPFINIIEKQESKEIQDYGIILLKYINHFIYDIQIKYNINYAKKFKYQYLSSNKKDNMYSLLFDDIPLKISFFHLIKLKIKSLIKFLFYNYKIHGFELIKYLFKEKYIQLGSRDNLSFSYLNKKKLLCHFYYKEFFISKIINLKLSKNQLQKFDHKYAQCIEIYIEPLIELILKIDNLFIENLNIEEIRNVFIKKLKSIVYTYNKLKISKIFNKKIIIGEGSNLNHKIISLSLQDHNQIIILHHGYDFCLGDNKAGYLINFGNINRVLVNNYDIYKNYNYYFKNYLSKFNSTEFEFLDKNLDNENKKIYKYTKQSKKVMLIGFPMNRNRGIYEPYLYFHSQIILEYYILKTLKEHNYHVIYKAHPDRLSEIGNILHKYCDEFVATRFEDVIDSAELFLFTYPSTTCFGYSLIKNKKIILFDQGVNWINSNINNFRDSFNIIKVNEEFKNTPFNKELLIKNITQLLN